jgi:hypothetical protein
MAQAARVANFIIAGTEKAGTTSLFTYLSAHPQVCGSNVKETDFFRKHYSGNREQDLAAYAKYFDRCASDTPIIMEASPGYLGEGVVVAPRIQECVPDAKLLFILRDPIDRLYSSYQFHLARLDIDQAIDFSSYVDRCIQYDTGAAQPDELGIGKWYLQTLGFGRYADSLQHYLTRFPRENIKIVFFEELNSDVQTFVKQVSEFLGITPSFYDDYEFRKVNVTFSSKSTVLHWLAVRFNEKAEAVLRQRPALKQSLVKLYKSLNQKQEGYAPMAPEVRAKLEAYYQPSKRALQSLVSTTHNIPWLDGQ